MKHRCAILLFTAFLILAAGRARAAQLAQRQPAQPQPAYRNFKVSVYIPVQIVQHMAADPAWLGATWKAISRDVHVDKVYIESYRGGDTANGATLEAVKRFFARQGVATAGGMALVAGGRGGQFRSLSYTNPGDRALLARISALTARHFNHIILDDFFFNSTKTDADIAAKGRQSWTAFRLQLMDEVSRDLILRPARRANPRVKIVIKFPNWYDHFQGSGYDLAVEPKLFDGIYTGTETRDPVITDQHLQQYESYEIIRYFDNVAPGRNGGGWVDTYDIRYVDRYAEQLWDTLLAKAPAITLFNWAALLAPAKPGARQAWANLGTTLNFQTLAAGRQDVTMATVAGNALRSIDGVLGSLGQPLGLKSYKPFQSHGEDFLPNYMGLIGLPMEMEPRFPGKAPAVLLTKQASFDPNIVAKIEQKLRAGGTVIITSGLLQALQSRGIEDIVEASFTSRPMMVSSFYGAYGAGAGQNLGQAKGGDILYPELDFYTNDAWPVVRGTANGTGVPMLLNDHYSKGQLFIWNIPYNPSDLYRLPEATLSALKNYVGASLPVRLNGPSQTSLFIYDNRTFVLESYLDHPVDVQVLGGFHTIENLTTGHIVKGTALQQPERQSLPEGANSFTVHLLPHSLAAFREQ